MQQIEDQATAPETETVGAEEGDEVTGSGEPEEPSEPAERTFRSLGLSQRLLEAIRRQGYERPTEVQWRAIPPALEGRDVIAGAQTGTGKTAAFTLPMIQRLSEDEQGTLRGLVLTPTRELAAQVERNVGLYGATTSLEPLVVYGGEPIGPQIRALEWGCDVLVATPGRLLDHLGRGTVDLSRIEVLVLDEADRMLDMGFIDDVMEIVGATPTSRQTLLFSATVPNAILSLAHRIMRDPVRVQVGFEAAAEGITEVVHPVDHSVKHLLLLKLLEEESEGQVLVFTRMKATARYLTEFLSSREISVDDLHGDKSQDQRTRSLQRFRSGETRILVATNVASRGLNIRGITHVVNFDVPEDPRDYVHRVGRTARADDTGDAVTLVSPHEWLMLRDIESLTGVPIERRPVTGFEPKLEIPPAAEVEEDEEEAPRASRLSRGVRRR